jgi:hypothetical protein
MFISYLLLTFEIRNRSDTQIRCIKPNESIESHRISTLSRYSSTDLPLPLSFDEGTRK